MERRCALRRLLAAHRPEDAAEAGNRREMLALLDTPGDPFTRKRFQPGHFTASGFVLTSNGGLLLLVHHTGLGRWLQPGGHVEPTDADLLAAARREIAEETGLEAGPGPEGGSARVFDLDVHPIPARGGEPAHLHFDVRFLFRRPKTAVGREATADGVCWVARRELSRIGPAATARVLRKLARAGF